ncbi:MAG: hypothetical protein AAGA55_06390, partial [Planctomycetota bacterium]
VFFLDAAPVGFFAPPEAVFFAVRAVFLAVGFFAVLDGAFFVREEGDFAGVGFLTTFFVFFLVTFFFANQVPQSGSTAAETFRKVDSGRRLGKLGRPVNGSMTFVTAAGAAVCP